MADVVAPAAPAPAPVPAPSTGYESNPLNLLMPSWKAILINIKAWLILILLCVLAGVVAFIAAGAFGAVGAGAAGAIFFVGIMVLLALILGPIIVLPISTVLVLSGIRGQKMKLREALPSIKQYGLKMLLQAILIGLIVIGGILLLIIPGIIFAVRYSLAPFVLVNENMGVMDSLKRTKELVKGRWFDVAGVVFFSSAVAIVALIPVVGPILSLASIAVAIMYSAASGIRYLQLKEAKEKGSQLPAVHPLNYVVLVVGIIASGVSSYQDSKDRNKTLQPQSPINIQAPQQN